MKTCSNSNCRATNIPDNAKYCPKCGQLLYEEKNNPQFNSMSVKDEKSNKVDTGFIIFAILLGIFFPFALIPLFIYRYYKQRTG